MAGKSTGSLRLAGADPVRLAGRIALHLVLIGAVLLIPPLVYDKLTRSGVGDSLWFFIGGLTYPLYLGWWIARIRHPRARTILLHLLVFITLQAAALLSLGKQTEALVSMMPAEALLPSIVFAVVRAVQRRSYEARTHGYAFLMLVPLALLFTVLFLYAMAMSATMGGMRY